MIDGLGLMTYRERLDKLNLITLLERRFRWDLIELFKIQEDFVCYGSDLFGHSCRTVAARSKSLVYHKADFFSCVTKHAYKSYPFNYKLIL